jgi:transposase-like protein
MPNIALTTQEKRDTLALLEKHKGNRAAAARAIGVSPSTFKHRVDNALADVKAGNPKRAELTLSPEHMLDRIYELEQALKSRNGSQINEEYIKRKIIGLTESLETARAPQWVVAAAKGPASCCRWAAT